MKAINIQGRKKTGKTTTVTNIIAELCRRGYSVGSIKGIHIDGFTMDSENEDTGKHKKAGADPVTARCHEETNIMFRGKMGLSEILKYYDNDWVVIESHVDLKCPNIITGRTDDMYSDQENEHTIGCSGVAAGTGIKTHKTKDGRTLPVINSVSEIKNLVDLIEEKTYEYVPSENENRREKTAEKETAQISFSSDTKIPVLFSAEIIEPEKGKFSLFENSEYIKISKTKGKEETCSDRMLTEHTIDIYVNEIKAGSIHHTPENIAELVLGWALGEGYYCDPGDVAGLEINDDGSIARISVHPKNKPPYALIGDIKPVKHMNWKKEWIFALAEGFEKILPLRKETMAAHNCRIARESEDGSLDILFVCEDIGRHSAIDKTIGWCVRNNVDMKDCIVFTSGRISRLMVQKVLRAGIPVMAGKGTISKKAAELASEKNLTLIGYAERDSCCIFADD